jgi:hypothetical protein
LAIIADFNCSTSLWSVHVAVITVSDTSDSATCRL